MIESAVSLDYTGLSKLRTSLQEGRQLDLIETCLLRSYLGAAGGTEEEEIFSMIRTRSKLNTLKDLPAIQDVISIINSLLEGNAHVVELRSKTPRTTLYGTCVNAIVVGASGSEYTVEVISDVKDLVTNNKTILGIMEASKRKSKDGDANGLRCLMESEDYELIHKVINSTLASTKYKDDVNFDSVSTFLDTIGSDSGFVVKMEGYTIVVFPDENGDPVVKSTTSDSPTFKDVDPTIFDLLFR